MKERIEIIEFIGNSLGALTNPEHGSKNFAEVKEIFSELKEMIMEMIDIAENEQIPTGMVNHLISYSNKWNEYYNAIKAYKLEDDARSNFRNRQDIIESIKQWYNSCLSGFNPQESNRPNNFLSIYNAIKNYGLKDIELERKKVNELVSDFQKKKQAVDTITDEFRKKSGEKTLADYSVIFMEESQRHSCFKIKWKQRIRIGNAEWWLSIGVLLVILFCYLLITENLNKIIPITNSEKSGEILINLITRLIIISTWVYLISFSFKQYSVNKHLATINRHRSNTLDSFKLLIEGIDPSDGVTKNALIMEVAKAIYEQGLTGHLSSKGSENNPSIIELTRFVSQIKSGQ